MIDAAAGALAMRAAKLAYDLWRENKGDSELPLSDKAKEVLATMQTDPTENGVFLCTRGLATVGLPLTSPFATDITVETTERVMRELEAKGLVSVDYTDRGTRRYTLSHAGWILNPQTGKADKIG